MVDVGDALAKKKNTAHFCFSVAILWGVFVTHCLAQVV
jgi:hypothetical protein